MEPITFTPRNSLRFLELYPDLEAWGEKLLKDDDMGIQEIGEDIRKISEYLKTLIPDGYIVGPKPLPPMLAQCERYLIWRGRVMVKALTLDSEKAEKYNDLVSDMGLWGAELRASGNPQIQEIGEEIELVEQFMIELPGIIIIQKPPPPMLGSCLRSVVWRGGEPE